MALSFEQLREKNKTRSDKWLNGTVKTLAYAMVELAGEVGEACNSVKKINNFNLGLAGGKNDIKNLIEELADVVICTDLVAMVLDIDLSEAVVEKFNKTSHKFGFLERLSTKITESHWQKTCDGIPDGQPGLYAILFGPNPFVFTVTRYKKDMGWVYNTDHGDLIEWHYWSYYMLFFLPKEINDANNKRNNSEC